MISLVINKPEASRVQGGFYTTFSEEEREERRRTFQYSDYRDLSHEELYAYMDEIYPRMEESDEEGIDLHPADPRRRFIMTSKGVTFFNPGPITEEEKAEVEHMLEVMSGGDYSPKIKKKSKK